MNIRSLPVVGVALLGAAACSSTSKARDLRPAVQVSDPLADFPAWAAPEVVGRRVAENLLGRPHMLTAAGSPDKVKRAIHYAEICTAYGALGFADLTRDKDLLDRLVKRYSPVVDVPDSPLIPVGFHGDYTVFALVPLEIYRQTGDERYLELGKRMVAEQWKDPTADGLTRQARWWNDDMYMIGAVESQCTRVTGDPICVDRAAMFLNAYLDRLQLPNGLVAHTTEAPQIWGRGVGWSAAGMVEALITLPEDHPRRARLMEGYKKLMAGLLATQGPNGLWYQLVDKPDSWEETSCTGMFTYAFVTGIKRGWLDRETYGPAARKAWLALVSKLDDKGRIADVCVGTNQQAGEQGYRDRPRRTGDFHGQAPLLWTANALLR